MRTKIAYLTAIFFSITSVIHTVSAIDTAQLSENDVTLVKSMIAKLEPFIAERKKHGNANMLTFDELYAMLEPHEQSFMNEVRKVKPAPAPKNGQEIAEAEFIEINDQHLMIPDPANPDKKFISVIERQYLPKNVFDAYKKMMEAMQKELGKQLLIESGYRSPAYQLYLFVYYLKNHDYSIKETNRWVAFPGHSEHNRPEVQAIDFINQDGISGENRPEDFENLDEYKWLTENAGKFGFVLSYPKNNTTNSAFEPWHWRYEGTVLSNPMNHKEL